MSYLPSSRMYENDPERGREHASDRASDRGHDREHPERESRRERVVHRERLEESRHERERGHERDRDLHDRALDRERAEEREREELREREEARRRDEERERAEEREREEERLRERERQRAEERELERLRAEEREREEERFRELERERLRAEVREREEERLEQERERAKERERERELERVERERLEREVLERLDREKEERARAEREREELELERLAAASVAKMAAMTTPHTTPHAADSSTSPPATSKRPLFAGVKEWLVPPAPPTLHVDTPTPETEPAAAPHKPAKKRNIFHKAKGVVLKQLRRVKNRPPDDPVAAATAGSDPAEPDVLWFAVMCLGSICMGLMIWGAYSALPRFGNIRTPLRAEVLSPKLRVTSDVPVRWGQEPHPATPTLPGHYAPLHPISPPPTHDVPHHLPAPLHPPVNPPQHEPLPPPQPQLQLHPQPFDDHPVFIQANLGDSPMIRTWKKLTESTLLLAALSAVPVNSAIGQIPEKLPIDKQAVDNAKKIDDLAKAIERIEKLTEQIVTLSKFEEKLNALKTELKAEIKTELGKVKVDAPNNTKEFAILGARLDAMEERIKNLRFAAEGAPPGAVANNNPNLDGIKNKLDNIEQAILKLQGPKTSIALSPPDTAPTPVIKTGTANIVFVNLWNQELTLFINQKTYPVPPGHTYADSVATGPTTIEVRSPTAGILHRASPNLTPNETFALTAR